MSEPNFVFLICSERSGSNLIRTILASHSGVEAPPPYHLCRDIGLNLHATLGSGDDTLAWREAKRKVVARVARFKGADKAERFARRLEDLDADSFCDLARFAFVELDDVAASQTVFIKENDIHQMLFFILRCFPDAKFVFQVRDPRDYLASARARRRRWLGNKFGSNRHAMETWAEDQLGGLRASAHLGPDRVFFQRYEDLISDPIPVLRSLCAFLGLDFEPGMLEFHRSEDAERLAQSGGARENLNKPLIAGNAGKYRRDLSGMQIKIVEAYVGDLMQRFGYRRDFPVPQGRVSLRVIWSQITEPLERIMNRQWRPFYSVGVSSEMDAGGAELPTPYTMPADRSDSGGD